MAGDTIAEETIAGETIAGKMIAVDVNGRRHALPLPGDTPLLYVLRNDLGLNGPKFGCGLGECGSCTVLVDGRPARSCVLPLASVAGRTVTTLEGLGGPERPHPVQAAFIAAQAAQCGYCLNGMIMTSVALLARDHAPSEAAIRAALRFNLCRCGAHLEILAAVRDAANRMGGQAGGRAP